MFYYFKSGGEGRGNKPNYKNRSFFYINYLSLKKTLRLYTIYPNLKPSTPSAINFKKMDFPYKNLIFFNKILFFY